VSATPARSPTKETNRERERNSVQAATRWHDDVLLREPFHGDTFEVSPNFRRGSFMIPRKS
jgi:hypothetical protein